MTPWLAFPGMSHQERVEFVQGQIVDAQYDMSDAEHDFKLAQEQIAGSAVRIAWLERLLAELEDDCG